MADVMQSTKKVPGNFQTITATPGTTDRMNIMNTKMLKIEKFLHKTGTSLADTNESR